jgi:hypothetical protein
MPISRAERASVVVKVASQIKLPSMWFSIPSLRPISLRQRQEAEGCSFRAKAFHMGMWLPCATSMARYFAM